ncbi:hypothetical protein ACJX0J_026381, partial [Zea mays]
YDEKKCANENGQHREKIDSIFSYKRETQHNHALNSGLPRKQQNQKLLNKCLKLLINFSDYIKYFLT